MEILVHTCCGPCATYVFQKLLKDGHRPMSFYYNPNIYPQREYNKRKEVAKEYLAELGVGWVEGEYRPKDYLQAIGENTKQPGRCLKCYQLRLSQTAQEAKKGEFEAFSTTLLISPYQDQVKLREVGTKLSQKYKVKFYEENFRVGYRKSRGIAGQRGMYQQKYCGCKYSLKEKNTNFG